MPTPYPVKFKLPLEFLTLQDWNNFVQNLLFINQYGPGKLLQYYQNGNFQNLDEVIAKYLYVSALKVAGYNVLHNLSEPLAYTFGQGNQQPFKTMSQRPTVSFPYSIPVKFTEFYPITKLPSYQFLVFPVEKLKVQLSAVSRQLQLLIPKLTSKIVTPHFIAGTQFQFSGTATVQTLIEDYLNPQYLQSWREITIQNLGSSAVQINNSIYLMPKQYLKLTASSPSEIQLTAQTPTLLSEEIEFVAIPTVAYTITITNSQPDPTPSPFQQLLNLNLSSLLSSSSQLLNLEFCLDVNCNTPLYAWIEQNNLSNAYIWINLPISIPANSSITIYMFIRNSIQYPYTGMTPYLSSTYGQYDNGENVFTFYDNFVGTTLSSKWTSGTNGGSITVNNGLILTLPWNAPSGSYVYVSTSSYTINSPQIVESYANLNGFNTTNFRMVPIALTQYNNVPWEVDLGKNENAVGWVGDAQATNTISAETTTTSNANPFETSQITSTSVYQLWGIIYPNNGSVTIQYNYQNWGSTTTYVPPTPLYITISNYIYPAQSSYTTTYPINVYYVRARAYPPNDVMPTNSQPQKTIVLVS